MDFFGIQKLTLLDYPGKVACTVFTGGCNFRCPFCHNASLVLRPGECKAITDSEILSFLKKRQGVLDGICITGGEPLMQNELGEFIKQVKSLGYFIKLDTNGSYPYKLEALLNTGLIDYVAMDIKNSKEKYGETVGIENYDVAPIEASIELLMKCGIDYEFRTTLVRELHSEADMIAIGKWIRGARAYYLQNYKDSGDIIKSGLSGFEKEEIMQFEAILKEYIYSVSTREI